MTFESCADIVTHPQGSGPVIAEMTLGKRGFQVWLHVSGSKLPRLKDVDLMRLLNGHERDAALLLRRLELALRAKWK